MGKDSSETQLSSTESPWRPRRSLWKQTLRRRPPTRSLLQKRMPWPPAEQNKRSCAGDGRSESSVIRSCGGLSSSCFQWSSSVPSGLDRFFFFHSESSSCTKLSECSLSSPCILWSNTPPGIAQL